MGRYGMLRRYLLHAHVALSGHQTPSQIEDVHKDKEMSWYTSDDRSGKTFTKTSLSLAEHPELLLRSASSFLELSH